MRLPARLLLAALVAAASLAAAAPAMAATSALKIAEFRLRGPSGANDEFVEIVNATASAHVVTASSGSGYALAASDGTTRFIIPNGTIIPPGGHFLGVNTTAYSLGSSPGGPSLSAGDATWIADIGDNLGIALFDTSVSGSFDLTTRIDAVGSSSEGNSLYREGTGYPALTPFSIDYALYRDTRDGAIADTARNESDLLFVDTNGTSAGAGQRLGAPSPQRSTAPYTNDTAALAVDLLDPSAPSTGEPNLVRDMTTSPVTNSTFGTVTLRRRITNTSSTTITYARLRITDLATFPSPSGVADERPFTSAGTTVTVDGSPVTVLGTTLETPALQPNGGGFGSSMRIDLGAGGLAPGASVAVQVRIGLQQNGTGRLCGVLETLPKGDSAFLDQRFESTGSGSGLGTTLGTACRRPATRAELRAVATADLGSQPVADGATAPSDIAITNRGTGKAIVRSVTLAGPAAAAFSVASDTCVGVVLAPNATCTVRVAFDPGTAGANAARLLVASTAGTTRVDLDGTGTLPAAALDSTARVFKPRAPNSPKAPERATFTIANQGPGALAVASVAVDGSGAAAFAVQAQTCTAAPIAPSAACTVTVAFTPRAAALQLARLHLVTNTAAGALDASLVGIGLPRQCFVTRLLGCSGKDRLRGTAKGETMRGGAGNDSIDAKGGDDKVFGDAGNDVLTGGAGRDTINGGAGNDRINARDRARDVIDCGAGTDVAVVDAIDAVKHCERVSRG